MTAIDTAKDFDLILVDPKIMLCEAWKDRFKDHEQVQIVNGYFETIPEFDCMVSAANSFGLMDGGVDLAIIDFFGIQLQHKVQQQITTEYYGEQPVGTSMIVETGHPKHPFIAHTPTMRVPLNITRMDNVYSAMFAMLRAVAKHNEVSDRKIKTVVCSGLGTSTGRVSPKEAARQMELAYRNFHHPLPAYNWYYVGKRQNEIIYGGNLWAQ